MNRRMFIKLAGLGALISAASYATYESLSYEVTEVRLPLNLGLKIMHISDLHIHGDPLGVSEGMYNVISSLSSKVDVTVITGDIYDERTPDLSLIMGPLSRIKGAKVCVLGNHEHWAHGKFPLEEGIGMLEGLGVDVLINDRIEIKGVIIGGIDWYHDELSIAREYLSKIGEVDILLSHTPDVIKGKPSAKLILAGHTHGGQVKLPLIGPLWTPSKYGYVDGLYREDGLFMYVNRGLGEWVIPIRVNCKKEVTLITA